MESPIDLDSEFAVENEYLQAFQASVKSIDIAELSSAELKATGLTPILAAGAVLELSEKIISIVKFLQGSNIDDLIRVLSESLSRIEFTLETILDELSMISEQIDTAFRDLILNQLLGASREASKQLKTWILTGNTQLLQANLFQLATIRHQAEQKSFWAAQALGISFTVEVGMYSALLSCYTSNPTVSESLQGSFASTLQEYNSYFSKSLHSAKVTLETQRETLLQLRQSSYLHDKEFRFEPHGKFSIGAQRPPDIQNDKSPIAATRVSGDIKHGYDYKYDLFVAGKNKWGIYVDDKTWPCPSGWNQEIRKHSLQKSAAANEMFVKTLNREQRKFSHAASRYRIIKSLQSFINDLSPLVANVHPLT